MPDFTENDLRDIERDRDNIDADSKPYDWADPELWNAANDECPTCHAVPWGLFRPTSCPTCHGKGGTHA